jgi:integrase
LRLLGSNADRDLSEIKKPQIVRFRDAEAKKFATATANLELKTVRMMFRQARIDQYILVDPAEGVKVLKDRDHDKVKRRPFTVEELRSILANADNEWQSLIKFGLYTGQRLADLATLRWTQIDLVRDEIRLTTRKTGKTLLIPIAAPLHEHLDKIADKDDALAPVHPKAFELVTAQNGRVVSLSNQFTEILVEAGLRKARNHAGKGIGRDGRREGMDVSFHSLRHTAVSLLKDAGIPDAVVMALIGHDTVAMSHRYTHVGKEALAKAAAKLPEL